jgi:hypothetical protein
MAMGGTFEGRSGSGWHPPAGDKSVRAENESLCRLSLSSGHCTAKKEFFFLNEQCGNVYENKGSLWKSGTQSGNVHENKSVICSSREYT